jgi:hypothetical protein
VTKTRSATSGTRPAADPDGHNGGQERDHVSETSEEETTPLIASRIGEIRDATATARLGQFASWTLDADRGRPRLQLDEPVHSAEGKQVAMLTSAGIWHIRVCASRGFEHTIMSREVAQRHGFARRRPRKVKEITGPADITIQSEDHYDVSFPMGPVGSTLKIIAYGVESMEGFCGLPQGSLKDWKMQLSKEDAGLLKLLKATC